MTKKASVFYDYVTFVVTCTTLACIAQEILNSSLGTMMHAPATTASAATYYDRDKSRSPHPASKPVSQRPFEHGDGKIETFPALGQTGPIQHAEKPPLAVTKATQYGLTAPPATTTTKKPAPSPSASCGSVRSTERGAAAAAAWGGPGTRRSAGALALMSTSSAVPSFKLRR